jgi:hypothetical protein
MTFKLVDTSRDKVLQEFDSRELAEKALSRQSVDAPIEIQEVSPPKKRTKKVVTTDGE